MLAPRSVLGILAGAVVAAAITGCGGAAPAPPPAATVEGTPEDAVRRAYLAYGESLLRRDFTAACGAVTDEAAATLISGAKAAGLPAGSCEEALGAVYAEPRRTELLDDSLRNIEITGVTVNGDTAVVDYASAAGGRPTGPLTIEATLVGGTWRFAAPR